MTSVLTRSGEMKGWSALAANTSNPPADRRVGTTNGHDKRRANPPWGAKNDRNERVAG